MDKLQFDDEEFWQNLYVDIQDIFLEALIDATPIDTGMTGASWKIKRQGNSILIYNERGDIIKFLEEGTGPHTIRPKPGKRALKFTINGRDVFAKKVEHPGTEALHFVFNVMNDKSKWAELSKRIAGRDIKLLVEQAFAPKVSTYKV